MIQEEALEVLGEMRGFWPNMPNNDATDRVWWDTALRDLDQEFAFDVINALAKRLDAHLIPSVAMFHEQRRLLQRSSAGVPPPYEPAERWSPNKTYGKNQIAEARRRLRGEQ